MGESNGAFSITNATQGPAHGTKEEKFYYGDVNFSAKNVNAIFGRSQTNQTASLRALAIIKW